MFPPFHIKKNIKTSVPRLDDGTGPRGGTTAAAGGKLGPQQPGADMPKTPCETQSQLGNSQENIGKTWENPLEIEVYSRNIHFKWRLSSQGKLSISKGFLPEGITTSRIGVYFSI